MQELEAHVLFNRDSNLKYSIDPEVIPKGDTLLLAVYHEVGIMHISRNSLLRLINVVVNTDHLLHEGSTTDYIDVIEGEQPDDVESFVYSAVLINKGIGGIHPLEDDSFPLSLMEQYGLDPETYFLSTALVTLQDFLDDLEGGSPKAIEKFADKFLTEFVNQYPEFGQAENNSRLITVEKFIWHLLALRSRGTPKEVATLFDSANKVVEFFVARIRDTHIIWPRGEELLANSDGVKTLMIGKSHIPYLSAAIDGIELPRLTQWSSFLERIDQKYRETFETVLLSS